MLKVIELHYSPPDRKMIVNIYCMEQAEREKVQVNLQNAGSFSITTDMWTSQAKQSYTALTVLYLNNDFELCCHILDTKEFQE